MRTLASQECGGRVDDQECLVHKEAFELDLRMDRILIGGVIVKAFCLCCR